MDSIDIVPAPSGQTRREFCVRACHAVSVATLGSLLGACGGGSPTSPGGGIGSSLPVINATLVNNAPTVAIDSASALASVGGLAFVQSSRGDFLVARTAQDAFTALSSQCTHQACTVSAFSGSAFVCPCHGSEFDTSGRVVRGPAVAPLHQYATQFSNNVLTISA